MDIRTLPTAERELYNGLRKRYSLHFKSREVQGHRVRLLMPSNLDELLGGQDPLDKIESFPFWFRLWESTLVLAHILVSDPEHSSGRLLEIGAGLGFAGLAAARAGFDVTLTDSDPIVHDFQRVSIAANNLTNVTSRILDGGIIPELGSFDVIAGAEILDKEEFVEPMLNICQNCLKPGGTIYLAHDVRRRCLPLFLERAEAYFQIGSRKQTIARSGRKTDVLVNRLRRHS